jgi:phosphate starvation-inducible PhoH-like protein
MSRHKKKKVQKRVKQYEPHVPKHASQVQSGFKFEFLNSAQRDAWAAFDQHDVLFLLGPAGCGKTQLSCAFAISEILAKNKQKIVMTRPVVEAGESLGFLPGTFMEKLNPYMMPMYDCMERCIGKDSPEREIINKSIEIAPIAYCRGRTFNDAICIFDEAQNATTSQIKLFMTRFGQNSKMIITGDPEQSDIRNGNLMLLEVANKMADLGRVGVIKFKPCSIVRHPLIADLLNKFSEIEKRS